MKKKEVISLIHEVVSRGGIPDIIVGINNHKDHKNQENDTSNNQNDNNNIRNSHNNRNSEVNVNENISGDTLLHLAIKYDLQDELLLLLTNGAPLYIKNNEGLTPERLAMKEGHQVMLQMLMRYKSHAKYVNKLGRGPNPRYNNHYSPNPNHFPRQLTHCSEHSVDSANSSVLTASDDGILGVFNDSKGTAIGTPWDLQNTSIHEEYLLWGDGKRSSQLKQQLQMLAKEEKELQDRLEDLQKQLVETKTTLTVDILQELRNKEHSFCMHIWDRLGLEQQIREELESISTDVYHTKRAIEVTQSHVFWSCRGYLRVWNGFLFTRWSPVTISVVGQQLQIKSESKYCSSLGIPHWQGCVNIPLEDVRGIRLNRNPQKSRLSRFWRFGSSIDNSSSREWRDIIISARCNDTDRINQKRFMNFFIRIDEQEQGSGSFLTSCIHNGRWVLQSSATTEVVATSDTNEEQKEEIKLKTSTNSDNSVNCGVIQGLFMALQFCGNSISPVYVEKVTSVHNRYFTSPKFTSTPLVRDKFSIIDYDIVDGIRSPNDKDKIHESPLTKTRAISNERKGDHTGGLLLRDSQAAPSFNPSMLTHVNVSAHSNSRHENISSEMDDRYDTSTLDITRDQQQQQHTTEVPSNIDPIIITCQDEDDVEDRIEDEEDVMDIERDRENARQRMERDISTHMRTHSSFISNSVVSGHSTNFSSGPSNRPTTYSTTTTTATVTTFAESRDDYEQSRHHGIIDHSNLTNMSNLSKFSDSDFAVSWKTGNSNRTDDVEVETNLHVDVDVDVDVKIKAGMNEEESPDKFYSVDMDNMSTNVATNINDIHAITKENIRQSLDTMTSDPTSSLQLLDQAQEQQLKLPISMGQHQLLSKGRKKNNRRSLTHTEILVTVLEDYEDLAGECSDNDRDKEEREECLEGTVGSTLTANSISIVADDVDEYDHVKHRPRARTANGRFMLEDGDSDVNSCGNNKSDHAIHELKQKKKPSNETIMSLSYDTGLAHHRNRTQTHPNAISTFPKAKNTNVAKDKDPQKGVVKSLHQSYSNNDDSLHADSQSLGLSSTNEDGGSRSAMIVSPIGAHGSIGDETTAVNLLANSDLVQRSAEKGIAKVSGDTNLIDNSNKVRSLLNQSTGSSNVTLSTINDLAGRPVHWLKKRLNQQRSIRGQIHLQLMEALTKREKLLERVHYLQALKKIVVDPPSAPTRMIRPPPLPSIEKSTFAAKMVRGMELKIDRSTKGSEAGLNDSTNGRMNGDTFGTSSSMHADIDKDLFVEYMMRQTTTLIDQESGGCNHQNQFDYSQNSALTDQENENDSLLLPLKVHDSEQNHNFKNNINDHTTNNNDFEDKSIVEILQTPSKSSNRSMRQRRLGAPPRDLVSSYELVMNTLNSLWKVELDSYENVKRLTDTLQQRERTLNLLRTMNDNSDVIDDVDNSEMYEIAF